MALAIFPGSLTNPSCIAAKRAVEGPSRRRSANFGAIFHNIGLQCLRALLLRELSLLSFFCPDVAFLWPASASLSGILTCYRANYCWKCSLDTKHFTFARQGGNTLSSRRRNAISCKTSMRRNRIRASAGFEPVTSAVPVRCSTNWAMKPHIGSKVNLLNSYLSVRSEMMRSIYEINNSYLNCGGRWKWRMIIAVSAQFKYELFHFCIASFHSSQEDMNSIYWPRSQCVAS